MACVVGLLTVELHIPHSRSLKEKRFVLRSLKDRMKKFNVSVAEVDHQDLWQRAVLAVAAAGSSDDIVEKALSAVVDEIERVEPGLITRSEIDLLT